MFEIYGSPFLFNLILDEMDLNRQTIHEWNALKFYYEYEEDLAQWRFWGSKNGLTAFVDLIASYATNHSNDAVSEHCHIGPYNYLKLMTWNEAIISDKYIAGTLVDLLLLSSIISAKLNRTEIGQLFVISHEYSLKSAYKMVFFVMADNFLPASVEYLE